MQIPSFAAAAVAALLVTLPEASLAQSVTQTPAHPPAVYAATNAKTGNAIVAYHAASNGLLTEFATYPTGGLGTGALTTFPGTVDPLASSWSIKVIPERHLLLVVNAGSGTLTEFAIGSNDALTRLEVVSTGGVDPVSIAASASAVYVANTGNPSTGIPALLTGYSFGVNGKLVPIAGSARTLDQPDLSRPGAIIFTPDGHALIATDTGADRVTTFAVGSDGRLGASQSTPSAGANPFGVLWHDGTFLVPEAGTGPGTATLSSYRLLTDGYAPAISPAVPSGAFAGCWIAARPGLHQLYIADTGSDKITSYLQHADGSLSLLAATSIAGPTGGNPLDLVLSFDGSYLYQLYGDLGEIGIYKTSPNGVLTLLAYVGGLAPNGNEGLAILY
jgi:6-phosphogluconolactonase (cycloisomerase 2 family)